MTVLLSLLLSFASAAPAEDPLDLVGLLVRDGAWDRAAAAVDAVDPDAADPVRYHALRGTIRSHEQRWDDAATEFTAAIAALTARGDEAPDPMLWLQLAQAELERGEPEAATRALAGAPASADDLAPTWLLRARAARDAGDSDAAWAALQTGGDRFPQTIDFPRNQVLLLVELGLYREAGERGAVLLAREDAGADDVLAIAEALRQGGATDAAREVLIQGELRFPHDVRLRVQDAGVSLSAGRLREAADQLAIAASVDPEYADEAAELFRKVGDLDTALRFNALVLDPATKARQRLGLLLEARSWDQAMALEPRLDRLGLLDESSVAYGAAYVRYQVHDLDAAESLLRRITDASGFAMANELRGAMDACRQDDRACP